MMNLDDHGFLSMDHLGDFDDVVSQLGTGYAVASSKRNADFHALFKNMSEEDYLIEGKFKFLECLLEHNYVLKVATIPH